MIGTTLAVFLGEAFLRLIPPSSPDAIVQPDSLLGWKYVPNTNALLPAQGSESVRVHINSAGFRDAEHSMEKRPDTFRILVLGDSMVSGTAGQPVRDQQLFTSLLQRELGDKSEIVQAAVPGWGTDQEFLYFLQEGYKYQPDLVLLAFFIGNDISDNFKPLERAGQPVHKPYFKLEENGSPALVNKASEKPAEGPASLASQVITSLRQHSKVYVLLHDRVYLPLVRLIWPTSTPFSGATAEWYCRYFATDAARYTPRERERALAVTRALLTALRDEVKARGSQFAVVLIPQHVQIYAKERARVTESCADLRGETIDWDIPYQMVEGVLKQEGINYLSLLPIFREHAEKGESLYDIPDFHLTPRGHAVTAQAISEQNILRGTAQSHR